MKTERIIGMAALFLSLLLACFFAWSWRHAEADRDEIRQEQRLINKRMDEIQETQREILERVKDLRSNG